MSAIWGMVDFKDSTLNENIAATMEEPYYSYKIDVFKKFVSKDFIVGYGGQFFTREAKNEVLPIIDGDHIFVADAVLDNRGGLFEILGVKAEERDEIPDGTLMYRIFRKYGKNSFDMFLGSFSFAYYDKSKRELLLATDILGSRSLYYCLDQGKLYFSTLMTPILKSKETKTDWNYRFLSDYLALDNLALYTEAEETPYQNLYKVSPGQAVIIKDQRIQKEDYWIPPVKTKRLKKSDEEFKKEFIKLFDRSVACVMRSSDKTGILLSGGLDSTSVACFAAPNLKEKKEMLYSYTSIPEKEYVSKEENYYITNEQKLVEITKNYLGNLSCKFLDLPDVNGFQGAEDLMEKMENPYKSLQNTRWIYEAAKIAAKDGCRILLTGQNGNVTISFGRFEMHIYSLFMSGHFIELAKEINAFCKKHRVRRKRVYRLLFANVKKGFLKQKPKEAELFKNVYINQELIRQYDLKKRFLKLKHNLAKKPLSTVKELRPLLADKKAFMQSGEFITHISLETGVLFRDPTNDRRIIEYCMSLPDNQFVHRGIDRRLVREYLRDYLPEEISTDDRHRGLQCADMIDRVEKNWEQIYQECNAILEEDIAAKLLDIGKIRTKLEAFKEHLPRDNDAEVNKLLYSVLLVRYLT